LPSSCLGDRACSGAANCSSHRQQHQELGSSLTSALALAVAVAIHHTHYSNHSPATPGILRVARVRPPLHSLHFNLGVPAALYSSAMPQWRLCQAILAQLKRRREAAVCSWMAMTLALQQWILLAVAKVWRYGLHSPIDLKLCNLYYSVFTFIYLFIFNFFSNQHLKSAYLKKFLLVVSRFSLLHCSRFLHDVPFNINCMYTCSPPPFAKSFTFPDYFLYLMP
jgi:hypothetical protein